MRITNLDAQGEPHRLLDVVCKCCLGAGLQGTDFWRKYGKHDVAKYFFRAALSPLFERFAGSQANKLVAPPSWLKSECTPAKATAASGGVHAKLGGKKEVAEVPKSATASAAAATATASVTASDGVSVSGARCNMCHAARATTELLKCSRCKSAFYCNATCQRNDWSNHKKVCLKA